MPNRSPAPAARTARRRALAQLLGAAGAFPLAPAIASDALWPAHPIRLVVPFPPGGGTDLAARAFGERLSARLGQPVVVENRPGASTAIGAVAVVNAPPDGLTLLFSGSTTFTVNPAVRPRVGYDPFRQLTAVALVARAPLVLLTGAAGPYASLAALLADAARRPGEVNYATFGPGSGPHLAAEMLAYARGVRLTPVAYKGSADAAIGLVRGDVALGIDTLAAAAPQVRAGRLRALAIVGEKRSRLMPEVPGYGELGLETALFDAWYALAAPANLPAPVLAALAGAVRATMAEPALRTRLEQLSMAAAYEGPDALRALMDREVARYRAIAARANLRLE